MYAKCESTEDAWRVFNKMPSQNVVSWTPEDIGSCEMCTRTEGTGAILTNAGKGVQPNSVTFVGVLKACVSMLVLVMAGVFMSRSLKVDVQM
jgi:pentatricopeptide repeat protein